MAKADTFNLTVTNGFAPSGPTYGTVTVLGTSTSVTIEFAAAAGFEFHNAGVGWKESLPGGASISTETVTTCTTVGGATCSAVGNGGNFDGFGGYTKAVGGGAGSSSGLTDVIITITGSGLALADFEGGFAGQISPYPNPTGAATGWVASTGSTNTTVPEPGTLTLLGTGLIAAASFLRRKLFA